MKNKNILIVTILIGLTIFGYLQSVDNETIPGGIVAAIIVGILLGKKTGNDSTKYAFISIFLYNILGWTLTFLLTADGKAVVHSGASITFVFIGFILVSIVIYAMIGSFAAFATSNIFPETKE